MFFLINYNRKDRVLVDIKTFESRSDAALAKLQTEISALSTGGVNEVVVLEAENIAALRVSHSRYFNDLSGIKFER